MPEAAARRRQLVPFAALSASYFAHIGFFNPYLPLWLQDLGFSILAISLLTSVQAATRLFAPYGWGALSDHTGERVKLLRYGATVALVSSLGLWLDFESTYGVWWLTAVLLVMFTHTSSMMPMRQAPMWHLISHGGDPKAGRPPPAPTRPTDCRGHARAGGDGACPAPARAMRRRGAAHAGDQGLRVNRF